MTFVVEYLFWDDDDKPAPSTADIGDVHPGMIFSNPPKYRPSSGKGTWSRIFYCYYELDTTFVDTIIGWYFYHEAY